MYKIIGSDTKEYGPVSTDKIREWLRQGRVNGQTKVKAENATDWQALGTLAEFAADFTAPPTGAPPASAPPLLVKAPRSKIPIWLVVLCVVGIFIPIAILAALLLPALSQAKTRAGQIACMGHLKQLALGVRIYSGDNKDTFPAATNWCEALTTYVSPNQSTPSSRLNVFACPTQPDRRCSYAYNQKLSGIEEAKVDPQTVMIFESDSGWDAAGGPELASAHHQQKINVAFADGHVEAVPVSRLPNLRWDPTPKAANQ